MKSNFILHAISNYMLSNCQDNQNPSGISNVSVNPCYSTPHLPPSSITKPCIGKDNTFPLRSIPAAAKYSIP